MYVAVMFAAVWLKKVVVQTGMNELSTPPQTLVLEIRVVIVTFPSDLPSQVM